MASLKAERQSRTKSCVFEIELDDNDPGTGFTAVDVLTDLLADIADSISGQRKLTDDAQHTYMVALSVSGEVDLERFAQLLAMHGHHVWLRTGRLECCFGHVALRHTFVLAGSGSDIMPHLFVVDPCFKEQFQLPNATPEYQALWQELPNLFVGTAEQLVPIVELMCTQMQRVFADTATSCPPWRTPSCMLTKWLPSAADDVPVAARSSSDGDSSSRPSSSNTNNALSSPAAPRQTSSCSLLAPIRTMAPQTTGLIDPTDALTPRSARSPLYFDQEQLAAKAFLAPSSPDELGDGDDGLAEPTYGAAGAKRSLLVHWGATEDANGLDVPVSGAFGDDSCFMASGSSWGIGTLASTTPGSPGSDAPWGVLRSCRSENVNGRVHYGPRARAMAIGQRTAVKVDQGCGGNGFAEAMVGRSRLGVLGELPSSEDDALPAAAVRAATATDTTSSSKGCERGVHGTSGAHRSWLVAGNPTLDISRFDRNIPEDVPAGPAAWALGAERFGSTSSGRKLGNTCSGKTPAVRHRAGGIIGQCSALSAAIAGKGLPLR